MNTDGKGKMKEKYGLSTARNRTTSDGRRNIALSSIKLIRKKAHGNFDDDSED